MKIIALLALIFSVSGAIIGYAMDWQISQDEKMHDMDKLLERQSVLNSNQVKYNEQIQKYNELRFQMIKPQSTEKENLDK